MDIKINLSEMKHLKEKSHYNYNFYSHGNMGIELLQICDEQDETFEYYLVDGESKVLLGSAQYNETVVDFMVRYT